MDAKLRHAAREHADKGTSESAHGLIRALLHAGHLAEFQGEHRCPHCGFPVFSESIGKVLREEQRKRGITRITNPTVTSLLVARAGVGVTSCIACGIVVDLGVQQWALNAIQEISGLRGPGRPDEEE